MIHTGNLNENNAIVYSREVNIIAFWTISLEQLYLSGSFHTGSNEGFINFEFSENICVPVRNTRVSSNGLDKIAGIRQQRALNYYPVI